jgi:xanthine dehydrogenase accessory factor
MSLNDRQRRGNAGFGPAADIPLSQLRVLIRGAGEMASGVAHRLARAGFFVLMTEVANPLAVRRAVSFCEAVHDGVKTVENISARLVSTPSEVPSIWKRHELPVLVDPEMSCLEEIKPQVIVDALLAKRNMGLSRDLASLTIGLGPGFVAPEEATLVIETNRGHDLGRLIYEGRAEENTGVPGEIGGYSRQRLLRAPVQGLFETSRELGDVVIEGQVVARVGGHAVKTQIPGILRGLIRPGTNVTEGEKLGDVDPRGKIEYLYTISEKSRAIAGSVLEGIMAHFNRP